MEAIALEADADLVVRRELPLGRRHDPDQCLTCLASQESVNHLLMAETLDRLDSGDGVCVTRIDQVKIIRPHAEQDFIW